MVRRSNLRPPLFLRYSGTPNPIAGAVLRIGAYYRVSRSSGHSGRPADEPLSRRGLQKGQDSAKKSGRFPRRHAGPWCWFWRPFSAAGAFIVVADGAALWAREAMSVWGFEVAKTPRSTFSCTRGCPQNFAEVWSPLRDSGSCAGRPETGAGKIDSSNLWTFGALPTAARCVFKKTILLVWSFSAPAMW